MMNLENRQNKIFETQQEMLATQGVMLKVLNGWKDETWQQHQRGCGVVHPPPQRQQQQSIIVMPSCQTEQELQHQLLQQQHMQKYNLHNNFHKPLSTVLRNSPRVPVFSNSLPNTVERLVFEHEVVYKLTEYQNVRMSGWPQRVKQAFGRRKFLYNTVINRANNLRLGTFQQRKEHAACSMDAECESLGGMSVYKYILYLKQKK